jgi:ketopantoate hydroxymethyltransferase
MTLPRLSEKQRLGEPIVMVTAYDFPSAQVAQEAAVDMVLVGDSGAMTVLGYPSTIPVSIDEMLILASAVHRGLRTPFLVGDLTNRRSPPPSGSSRRPAAMPSSWSAAAPASSAHGRSSTPGSR